MYVAVREEGGRQFGPAWLYLRKIFVEAIFHLMGF